MALKCTKARENLKKGQESKETRVKFVGTQIVGDVRCLKEVKGPKTKENVLQKRVFQSFFFFMFRK